MQSLGQEVVCLCRPIWTGAAYRRVLLAQSTICRWSRRDTVIYFAGGASPVAPVEQVCEARNRVGSIKSSSTPVLQGLLAARFLHF